MAINSVDTDSSEVARCIAWRVGAVALVLYSVEGGPCSCAGEKPVQPCMHMEDRLQVHLLHFISCRHTERLTGLTSYLLLCARLSGQPTPLL